jgi:hypothetical protein
MNTKIIFLGLVLIASASVARAAEITMHYSGTVTSTNANAVTIAEIEVGDSVTGQFTFNSDAPDESPAFPLSGLYEANSLTLTVQGFNYTASDNNISITNDSILFGGTPVDAFEIVSGLRDVVGPSLSELPPVQIDLVIVDIDAMVFADDSLPIALDVGEFEITSEESFGTTGGRLIFQSLATGGIGEVRFEINSIIAQSNDPVVTEYTGIQITELSPDITGSVRAGDTVTFTVDALTAPGVGPLNYRFFTRKGYESIADSSNPWGGTTWQLQQNWSTMNSAPISFAEPGFYILVVHCSEDTTWSTAEGDPQIGMVVEVWPAE